MFINIDVQVNIEKNGTHKNMAKKLMANSDFSAQNLFLNEEFSDIKIKCHGELFPCHKNVLAARSKYFKTCLSQVGSKESEDGIIEITDFPPKIVESLLRYIYTNDIAQELVTIGKSNF